MKALKLWWNHLNPSRESRDKVVSHIIHAKQELSLVAATVTQFLCLQPMSKMFGKVFTTKLY